MNHPSLTAAVRAAIAAHRAPALRQLLAEHGSSAFAAAVATCSPRVAADILSLLAAPQRTQVLRQLPPLLLRHLRPLGLDMEAAAKTRFFSAPRLLTPSQASRGLA